MSWSLQTNQFWVGTARDEAAFGAFFAEDDSRDELEDYDDVPVSKLAASQGEVFIDHDFTEGDFQDGGAPLAERFWRSSWAGDWGALLEARVREMGIEGINCFFMIGVDAGRDGRGPHRQVDMPRDATADGIKLRYIGEISFWHWTGLHSERPATAPPAPAPPHPGGSKR